MDKMNPNYSPKSSVYPEIRPIDVLRFEHLEDGSVRYVSDTTLLLNQERIVNSLGEESYIHMIRSLSVPPKTYSQGNYYDRDLSSCIKSRYCQSHSEMRDWINSVRLRGYEIIQHAKDQHEKLIQAEIERQAVAAQSTQSIDA